MQRRLCRSGTLYAFLKAVSTTAGDFLPVRRASGDYRLTRVRCTPCDGRGVSSLRGRARGISSLRGRPARRGGRARRTAPSGGPGGHLRRPLWIPLAPKRGIAPFWTFPEAHRRCAPRCRWLSPSDFAHFFVRCEPPVVELARDTRGGDGADFSKNRGEKPR